MTRTNQWRARAVVAALVVGAGATLAAAQVGGSDDPAARPGSAPRGQDAPPRSGDPGIEVRGVQARARGTTDAAWVQAVERAHQEFRSAVASQLREAQPMGGGTLDESQLMVTSVGDDRLVAGAPTMELGGLGGVRAGDDPLRRDTPGLGERPGEGGATPPGERGLPPSGREGLPPGEREDVPSGQTGGELGRPRQGEPGGAAGLPGAAGVAPEDVVGVVLVTGPSVGTIEASAPDVGGELGGERGGELGGQRGGELGGERGGELGGARAPALRPRLGGVPQGAYLVRLSPDQAWVELVDETGRIAATAPLRPESIPPFGELEGLGRERAPRGGDVGGRQGDMPPDEDGLGRNVPEVGGGAGAGAGMEREPLPLFLEPDWPTIYLAVLRAAAPELRR